MIKFSQYIEESADKSLVDKASKSGIIVGTLKKVYNRGVAAWKTGHRPGTTPSQWGHARVNAFIVKKKKASAVVFPSNFCFPHAVLPVKNGDRHSIITWIQ